MKKFITYKSLSKEEKNSANLKFKKSKRGTELNKIYLRLLIEGIVCIAATIVLIIYALIKHEEWIYYVYSAFILLFGIIFIAARTYLKRKAIEQMLNK